MRYPHQLKNPYSKKEQCPSKWGRCTHQGVFSTLDDAAGPPESEGIVTAIVAKMKYQATDSQTCRKREHPDRHCTSNNIIRVLLDSGSDGDLWFHEKGTPMHFPYLTRQVPLLWHTTHGSFLTKGRSQVVLKFFEYSNSQEYHVTPDIVEYDKQIEWPSQCITSLLVVKPWKS